MAVLRYISRAPLFTEGAAELARLGVVTGLRLYRSTVKQQMRQDPPARWATPLYRGANAARLIFSGKAA